MITFRQLQEMMADFTPEQLNCTATVLLSGGDELFPVTELRFETQTDVLDAGHPYLVIPYD